MQNPSVTVSVVRSFAVDPARLFDAWITPDLARLFLFATPDGLMVRVEIDPVPGGAFVFTDLRSGVAIDHVGNYLAVERPHRLAFRFAVPHYTAVSTDVVIVIDETESGSALTLTHTGVWPEYEASTIEGWNGILQRLAEILDA